VASRNPFRLVIVHVALLNIAWASGGAFVGAYLLRLGFSLPQAIASYAGIVCFRFVVRFAWIEVVRRLGFRRGLVLGTLLCALEFPILLGVDNPWGLAGWIVVAAAAESLYWPLHHAVTAVACNDAGRGRQLGLRQSVLAMTSVIGPLTGGLVIAHLGAKAIFAASAVMCLAGILPILLMGDIQAGTVPSLRRALDGADRRSLAVFAADGWICSGYITAWGLVLFSTLGDYEAFGWVASMAALASAGASFACGRALDRGNRHRYLKIASAVTAGSILLRAFSFGSPTLSVVASVSGAAVSALYAPVVMSMIYARAKSSGEPYRFHLALEPAWDIGMIGGCAVAACVAAWCPVPSLCMLPSVLGVVVVYLGVVPAASHPTGRRSWRSRSAWTARSWSGGTCRTQ